MSGPGEEKKAAGSGSRATRSANQRSSKEAGEGEGASMEAAQEDKAEMAKDQGVPAPPDFLSLLKIISERDERRENKRLELEVAEKKASMEAESKRLELEAAERKASREAEAAEKKAAREAEGRREERRIALEEKRLELEHAEKRASNEAEEKRRSAEEDREEKRRTAKAEKEAKRLEMETRRLDSEDKRVAMEVDERREARQADSRSRAEDRDFQMALARMKADGGTTTKEKGEDERPTSTLATQMAGLSLREGEAQCSGEQADGAEEAGQPISASAEAEAEAVEERPGMSDAITSNSSGPQSATVVDGAGSSSAVGVQPSSPVLISSHQSNATQPVRVGPLGPSAARVVPPLGPAPVRRVARVTVPVPVPVAAGSLPVQAVSGAVPTTNTHGSAKFVGRKPAVFSESGKVRLDEWLNSLDVYFRVLALPSDQKVDTLLSFLEETTLNKVMNARIADLSPSYEDFKKALRSLIGKAECPATFRASVGTAQQDSAESVTDFAARVMSYVTRAYPVFAASVQATLASDAFVRGLRNVNTRADLQARTANGVELPWADLVGVAAARESALQIGSSVPMAALASGPSRSVDNARSSNDTQAGSRYSVPSRGHVAGSWRDGGDRVRSNFGSLGGSRGARSSAWSSVRARGGRNGCGSPRCSRCGKRGHVVSNCWGSSGNYGSGFNRDPNGSQNSSFHPQFPVVEVRERDTRSSVGDSDSQKCGGSALTDITVVEKVIQAVVGPERQTLIVSAVIKGNRYADVLLDTGSSRSMIHRKVVNDLSLGSLVKRRPTGENMVGIGGGKVREDGILVVPLEVAGRTFNHPLVVTVDCVYSVLIGMDIARAHGARIDVDLGPTDLVCFKRDTCPGCVPFGKESEMCWEDLNRERVENSRSRVEDGVFSRCRRARKIPAHGAELVRVELPACECQCLLMVEPPPYLGLRYGIDYPPVVLERGCSTDVEVLMSNSLNQSIDVEEGYTVALVSEVDLERCSSISSIEPASEVASRFARLWPMINVDSSKIDRLVLEGLKRVIERHTSAFALSEDEMGRTTLLEHVIDVGDSRPIAQAARRLPYGEDGREKAEMEIDRLRSLKAVRLSNSPWASPIVMARKKDGSIRMCVDYRKLNAVTKRDSYPLPRLDEALDSFAGSCCFSSLDIQMAYHQVPVREEDKAKTAFITHSGLYEYEVLPFGLSNAPATFQRLMGMVLAGLVGVYCIAYLDDIIVYSRSIDQHLVHLEEVLSRLARAGLKLKPKKCSFFRSEVNYLGHRITTEGILPDEAKIVAVKKWPVPVDAVELRRFLGFVGFYRRFMERSAEISAVLYDAMTEPVFEMTPDRVRAFEELRLKLVSAPVLVHPDMQKPFIVETDASLVAIGAVLLQKVDEAERPVAYYSKKLSEVERRYSANKRELLGTVRSIKHFRVYLLAREFVIRTDHKSNTFLVNRKIESSGVVADWMMQLNEFKYSIEHKKGSENVVADALSRITTAGEEEAECDSFDSTRVDDAGEVVDRLQQDNKEGVQVLSLISDDSAVPGSWIERQSDDCDIATVINYLNGPSCVPFSIHFQSQHVRALIDLVGSLRVLNGLLYYSDPCYGTRRLVVPVRDRENVIWEAHLPQHCSEKNTRSRIAQRFFWPGLRHDVLTVIGRCRVCDGERVNNPSSKAPLGALPAGYPFETVHMDLVGGQSTLTREPIGNRSILTIIDAFSGWAEAIPLPDQKAETVAYAFFANWVCRYGVPERVHTDQGTQFEGALFQNLCDLLKIHKSRTTPYHPQGNGKIERFNRTLVNWLRKGVGDRPEEWERVLPHIMMAYRSTISETTRFTPYHLTFGREMRLGIDYGTPLPEPASDVETFASKLLDKLEWAYTQARENIHSAHLRSKDLYDSGVVHRFYRPGSWVRQEIVRVAPNRGIATKFQAKFSGLLKVLDTRGPLVLTQNIESGHSAWRNHDSLRRVNVPIDISLKVDRPFSSSNFQPAHASGNYIARTSNDLRGMKENNEAPSEDNSSDHVGIRSNILSRSRENKVDDVARGTSIKRGVDLFGRIRNEGVLARAYTNSNSINTRFDQTRNNNINFSSRYSVRNLKSNFRPEYIYAIEIQDSSSKILNHRNRPISISNFKSKFTSFEDSASVPMADPKGNQPEAARESQVPPQPNPTTSATAASADAQAAMGATSSSTASGGDRSTSATIGAGSSAPAQVPSSPYFLINPSAFSAAAPVSFITASSGPFGPYSSVLDPTGPFAVPHVPSTSSYSALGRGVGRGVLIQARETPFGAAPGGQWEWITSPCQSPPPGHALFCGFTGQLGPDEMALLDLADDLPFSSAGFRAMNFSVAREFLSYFDLFEIRVVGSSEFASAIHKNNTTPFEAAKSFANAMNGWCDGCEAAVERRSFPVESRLMSSQGMWPVRASGITLRVRARYMVDFWVRVFNEVFRSMVGKTPNVVVEWLFGPENWRGDRPATRGTQVSLPPLPPAFAPAPALAPPFPFRQPDQAAYTSNSATAFVPPDSVFNTGACAAAVYEPEQAYGYGVGEAREEEQPARAYDLLMMGIEPGPSRSAVALLHKKNEKEKGLAMRLGQRLDRGVLDEVYNGNRIRVLHAVRIPYRYGSHNKSIPIAYQVVIMKLDGSVLYNKFLDWRGSLFRLSTSGPMMVHDDDLGGADPISVEFETIRRVLDRAIVVGYRVAEELAGMRMKCPFGQLRDVSRSRDLKVKLGSKSTGPVNSDRITDLVGLLNEHYDEDANALAFTDWVRRLYNLVGKEWEVEARKGGEEKCLVSLDHPYYYSINNHSGTFSLVRSLELQIPGLVPASKSSTALRPSTSFSTSSSSSSFTVPGRGSSANMSSSSATAAMDPFGSGASGSGARAELGEPEVKVARRGDRDHPIDIEGDADGASREGDDREPGEIVTAPAATLQCSAGANATGAASTTTTTATPTVDRTADDLGANALMTTALAATTTRAEPAGGAADSVDATREKGGHH